MSLIFAKIEINYLCFEKIFLQIKNIFYVDTVSHIILVKTQTRKEEKERKKTEGWLYRGEIEV